MPTYIDGDSAVLVIDASEVTGQAFQLKSIGATEIGAANKGFFWKVDTITFNPVQNTEEKSYVGTDSRTTIATNKNYDVSIALDLYTNSDEVTLTDGGDTYDAIDPKTVLKQVVAGNGEWYKGKLYLGCSLGAGAVANAGATFSEDFAKPSTATITVTLTEIKFVNFPLTVNPGAVVSTTLDARVKTSTVA